jgi:hypothetical protein
MNKITLEKIHSTESCYHIKLLINDKDVGILYLKESEMDMLYDSLKKGAINADVTLESNIYDCDEDEFEDDIDN